MGVKRIFFVAVLVASGVAGCDSVVTGEPVAGGSVDWGSCPAFPDIAVPADAQCGEVLVPLDYSKPEGPRARIALARLPATGEKIGSLLLNFGGPGLTGADTMMEWIEYYPAQVRERFDLVGFDPRGVGRSRPAVECNTDAENDRDRAEPGTVITGITSNVGNTAPEVAEENEETEDYVRRCAEKTDKDLLANLGTEMVAKDMDRIREAVGDDKLNYVGFSYGTLIGAVYAELFPERVRAMVLDGAVDPAVDPMQAILDQAVASQKAFDAYAADCARKSRDCPLGTDPGKAVDRFHALVDPLEDRPAPTNDARGLSYNDALTAVWQALFSPNDWEPLTAALTDLRDRKPADDLLAMADDYNGRNSQGHYDNTNDAFHAILCADFEYPTDGAAWAEHDRKYRASAPFASHGASTGHALRLSCAFWPVPADDVSGAVSAPGLPRVLVISTTGDPATPYLDGVHLAEQMDAALLTVEGTQHTAAFYDVPCVDDIVAAYLVDLTLPPADKRCSIG
jgi:pimeloyl-ACP methyl ester carboxylesterase